MDRLRNGQAQGGAGRSTSREEQGVRCGDDGRGGAQAEGIPLTRTRRLIIISLIF